MTDWRELEAERIAAGGYARPPKWSCTHRRGRETEFRAAWMQRYIAEVRVPAEVFASRRYGKGEGRHHGARKAS